LKAVILRTALTQTSQKTLTIGLTRLIYTVSGKKEANSFLCITLTNVDTVS